MSNVNATNEIRDTILNYVFDSRRNQAVLLTGEWGCGKSYFAEKELIPEIKKNGYQVFRISLYGISNVESIQDIIMSEILYSIIEGHVQKFGPFGGAIAKGIKIFGKSALSVIETKIGSEGSLQETATELLNNNASDKDHTVFIFDDIERCQIDIIELMGFLNNLSENQGYRLVLIANENEISKNEDDYTLAAKYNVALNNRIDISADVADEQEPTKLNKNQLNRIVNHYFTEKDTYKRTREKLIGLTVKYDVPLKESFEQIILEYVKADEIRNKIKTYEEPIIEVLSQDNHHNLRTLITCFIAIEDILSVMINKDFDEKDLLDEEILLIVKYIVYSASRNARGNEGIIWDEEKRYGLISNDNIIFNQDRHFGYAFIDEYWNAQHVDPNTIINDITSSLKERARRIQEDASIKEHANLALFKLYEWYKLEDNKVKELIKQMKEELEDDKYQIRDFKEIVLTLMRINNPNFGLATQHKSSNSDSVYISTEEICLDEKENQPYTIASHYYEAWEQIDISEYVGIMLKYIERNSSLATLEDFRIISEDKWFIHEYKKHIKPLTDIIESKNFKEITTSNTGIPIIELEWNDDFFKLCREKQNEFMNKGKFLSLFSIEKIKEKIKNASVDEVYNFIYAMQVVYSFQNLKDIFLSDVDVITSLIEYIEKEKEKSLNPNRCRTKEIAFKLLNDELQKYITLLSVD